MPAAGDKKKVLFTSHTANFAKFNRPFMRWFKENDWEVHYASAGEEEVLDTDQHFNIPFERNPLKAGNVRAYFKLKKIINKENYDIIHTHTPTGGIITRLSARKSRKNGTKVIYTAHGFHFFKGAALINWLIYYPIERIMAHITDILIVINKEDYELANRNFKTRVEYVPGVGVDVSKFSKQISKKQRTTLRNSLGLKSDDTVLIYVAELSKRKRQTQLLESSADTLRNNPKLHLILPGHDSLNKEVHRLVETLNLTDKVHLLGYRSDISDLLKISDIYITSSSQEGLAVNVMEAQATGLPVIATSVRGNSDLIEDRHTGILIDPNLSNDIPLESIISNNSLLEHLSRNSRQKAEKYEVKQILGRMSNIYLGRNVVHLLASKIFSGAENVAANIISKSGPETKQIYCSPRGSIESSLEAISIPYVGLDKFNTRSLKKVVTKYKPDIIHAHDFKASILASKFQKKTKIISHIHQNPRWINGSSLDPRFVIFRAVTHRLSAIITVSEEISSSKLLKKVKTKVHTVYNTVDTSKLIGMSKEFKTDTYDMAFCGRLEHIKRPDRFIQIVEEVKKTKPSIRAVIIGAGSMQEEITNYIESMNLTKNIDVVGFQSNPYPYIANSNYLVITSEREGFSLVAVEATILESMVLSLDIPGPREILTEQQLFKNIKSISHAIESNLAYTSNPRINLFTAQDSTGVIYRIYENTIGIARMKDAA